MCHPLPPVPIARGHGNCAKPTGPVRQEQIGRQESRHRQRELEQFVKDPRPAFLKLVKSLD